MSRIYKISMTDLNGAVSFGGGGGGGGGGGRGARNPNMRQMNGSGNTYSPHRPSYGPPNYRTMTNAIYSNARVGGWAVASTVPTSRVAGFAIGVAGSVYESSR